MSTSRPRTDSGGTGERAEKTHTAHHEHAGLDGHPVAASAETPGAKQQTTAEKVWDEEPVSGSSSDPTSQEQAALEEQNLEEYEQP
ncbi:Uu.00g126640.m01.CDS01 [Anthostomella pinea]|uniref:Uu.00g126640.m01.CDS01 n=1 Tax=Anthostomella pinea TaxID=933095 RepID=A0AAI8VI02_9PEZI|nr:Uu.00g126640.m01.CDS01 [Anthostomella pinea]